MVTDTKGAITLSDWLEAQGAARDVVDWARPLGDRWKEAWETCPRGDWLLGLAARLNTEPSVLLRASTSCAQIAETYLPDNDQRARRALKALELHLAGALLSAEQLAELAVETEAAVDESPDPAAAAAALSVLACLRVLEHPGEAALAAASVAQAAVLDTGDCAIMSALNYAHRTCADRVREALPFESLELPG